MNIYLTLTTILVAPLRFSKAPLLAGLLLSALSSPVLANTVSIVATVNGDPITSYEVAQRIAMLEDVTNIEVTDENRQRIAEDALQMLIDDSLKLQVGVAANPGVKTAAIEQAKELIGSSFGTDTKSGTQVLREIGIEPMTVQAKFISDLVWNDYLRRAYDSKFQALDAKVESEIERLEKNASQPQIRLSEIVLPLAPNRNLQQTKSLAAEIVAAVRKGANFNAIAQQYSGAGSAQQGGRIGWVVFSRLPKPIADALTDVVDGEVTEPIELDGSVYIFRREGERKKGFADESQSRVWMARAIIPIAADASNADRLEAAARIGRDTQNINSCEQMEALNNSYESASTGRLDGLTLADLAPQMRKLVAELEDNQPSEPIAFNEGIATMMICKREKPKINLPAREDVYRMQYDKLFGDLSERHLVRLRRSAVIDRRN